MSQYDKWNDVTRIISLNIANSFSAFLNSAFGIALMFVLTFNYVHACFYVEVYAHELKLSIEGIGYPGARVPGSCEPLDTGMGTETRSSVRAT